MSHKGLIDETMAPCKGGCGIELILNFESKPQLCYPCQLYLHAWSDAYVFCMVMCRRNYNVKEEQKQKEYAATLPDDAIRMPGVIPYWFDDVPRHLPGCTVSEPASPFKN